MSRAGARPWPFITIRHHSSPARAVTRNFAKCFHFTPLATPVKSTALEVTTQDANTAWLLYLVPQLRLLRWQEPSLLLEDSSTLVPRLPHLSPPLRLSGSSLILYLYHFCLSVSVSCGSSLLYLITGPSHLECILETLLSGVPCERRLVHRTRADSSSTLTRSISGRPHLASPLFPFVYVFPSGRHLSNLHPTFNDSLNSQPLPLRQRSSRYIPPRQR
jgi:hypothetical protein